MAIAELAEEVAREHAPRGAVSPAEIAKGQGLTLSFGSYGNAFDGMLECRRSRFHIYCNLDRVEHPDSPRSRFTLGHELGHFFIDDHRLALLSGKAPAHPSRTEYESKNQVEQEADHFAAHLLMPTERFSETARRTPVGLRGVLSLVNDFRTSVTSTAIRYAQLDLVPCAVLKWGNDGLAWKWLSTETFAARYRKTIESTKQLPTDSPTAMALRGESPPTIGYFECGTTAAAWFPFVTPGATENVLFIEQAIPLGRFGVLTFLYPEAKAF
ncbi:MAG: ImmA/IrrE family metallo-endopeptidase [Acidobacteriota bacterium]|nr:ImmA/IrrE family metallo-endopeptidase [Acidobacteriota bacterium]